MTSRFVRASKYRHVFGTAYKRDQCYDNIKVSRNAWDSNLVKVNSKFISINLEAGGGGAFTVIALDKVGKLCNLPVINGHTAAVLDTDFNPFNDYVVASCGEDCKVMVWSIPEGGLTENLNTPVVQFNQHTRKVGHVLFHPTAENVLLSSSADLVIRLYDIQKGVAMLDVNLHTEIVNSLAWNYDGSLLATTSKDKKLRIIDVRENKVVSEVSIHQGVKGSRVAWLGDSGRLITTGFSKTSDRQYMVWDSKNLTESLKSENLDTQSGGIMPYYDNDTKMVYMAGKGDGNIRYFECVDEPPYIYYLTEYKSGDPQRGIGFMPKRVLNIGECEISRAYKVHVDRVEPIAFKVPRKSDQFQADIFPDTLGDKAAMTAEEWFGGKNANPDLINLEKGFVPSARSQFLSAQVISEEPKSKIPQSEKEYQEAYHTLRKENETLKNEVAQKDVRIRQLELQMDNLMKGNSREGGQK